MSDWGPNTSHSYTTPGTTYVGDIPQPFFRDQLDAERSMWGRTPEAQYPSGYLGTYRSRREDRIQGSSLNKKNYNRGVHVGERRNPADYFWPDNFDKSGLIRQATTGERFAPSGGDVPVILVNDGKSATPGEMAYAAPGVVGPVRPPWR
jgi:hypothetical protein